MARPRYMIRAGAEPGEDYIQVLRGKTEVLYWGSQEWIEDPSLVLTIVNAVAMAIGDPEMMDIKLREIGILK